MEQRNWIVPIPGTTKLQRLKENLNADQIIFSNAEMVVINVELSKIQIKAQGIANSREVLVKNRILL